MTQAARGSDVGAAGQSAWMKGTGWTLSVESEPDSYTAQAVCFVHRPVGLSVCHLPCATSASLGAPTSTGLCPAVECIRVVWVSVLVHDLALLYMKLNL